MDAERTIKIIKTLVQLCNEGTYQCTADGARNITTVLKAAALEVARLEAYNITKEEEDE